MDRLDLSLIQAHAGDKSTVTVDLSPVSYCLLLHLLSLLQSNQWLFVDAGEDERDATDLAFDELSP
jgi:hypothetical protein